jgi:O-acetylhomoserine (thiol)-lyase
VTLPRLGLPLRLSIRLTFNLQKRQENTKVFCREFGNPKLDVLDLKSISAEAKKLKVLL